MRKVIGMIKIGVKRGYIALLIMQAVSIGICAFALIRIYYNNNTSLLYQQASAVLNLYMLNGEKKSHALSLRQTHELAVYEQNLKVANCRGAFHAAP